MTQIKEASLRAVRASDIKLIRKWWADSRVMTAVGFPNGLQASEAEVWTSIAKHQAVDFSDFLIILDEAQRPIGEFHYRQVSDNSATFGIKIGDYASQGKGYGKAALLKGLALIQTNPALKLLEIQVAADNLKAIGLYEKLGFVITEKKTDNWTDQLGNLRSTAVMQLKI
ncbi:GNAT family N-acetyltransferase [Enterococcus sp. HY326]|uniref:GNAT family N-acetyltransferase n=1 Tax=Enterococcus sp. HY326 TaxID=2971265 RepID=UPI00223F32E0|nr:GNAT family protein [Enterococcus sp. HY326]